MNTLMNYINSAPAQSAGKIIFLLALALILGSSLLAFISELTHKPGRNTSYPIRSRNITRSSWLWAILFSLFGGIIYFLPKAATLTQSSNLMVIGICTDLSLLFFLTYHFTLKSVKSKILHTPLALLAAGSALTAAAFWFLPSTYIAWVDFKDIQGTNNELISWWLNQQNIACFIHFILNSIAVSALVFMLANAKEKEKKRKQPRDYYFKASGFAGGWLMAAVTLQIIPLGWLLYNFSTHAPQTLFSPPEVYWFAGIIVSALSGWLLLAKINKDALVNYRATLIIALFFIISLSLFHFGPLSVTNTTQSLEQNHKVIKIKPQISKPVPDNQKQVDTLETTK